MIQLTYKPLEILPVIQKFTHPDCGAVVTFLGVTRNHHGGKKVVRLSYEAYEVFAIQALERIREEMVKKYEIRDMAILHRLGEVEISETSLLVVVCAPHRGPAISAMSEAIEILKKDVPIWKKEFYEDSARWIEGS